jgi:histidinol phosphatase-like enzyme
VNQRVEELLGPFDVMEFCPHGGHRGCRCRKPQAGLVLRAARHLGLDPRQVVVVADTAADVLAGLMAGTRAIMVPSGATRGEELGDLPEVEPTLATAVERILAGPPLQGTV